MSYLPYIMDFETHRTSMGYSMSFMPNTLFEALDPSAMEYFPKLSNFSGVRKPSKDRFEVYLDVEDYGPDEIKVKTIDGFVVVEGQHEEQWDGRGWVQRQFQRRCPLPEGYKTQTLLSQYSSDGTLTITASLVKIDEAKYDTPVTKRQEGEEKASDEDPGQPEDADGNQSDKKPVKSKPKEKTVEVKVEIEESQSTYKI
ncbi:unnamed protein product [Euphydryas editha]|uniref:SHSP domain-containing protein n=1 Tax=Euphydryas editha TaxID=104508 RepID=A0AAU9UTW2_EUPED|nr:unnamed protein product [Euphydryas editha]